MAGVVVVDDSCRRPGSVPFKWEVCPGTPKHVRSASASASSAATVAPPPSYSYYASSSPASSGALSYAKVAVSPKLAPPPAMSPSPYHSPRVSSSYYAARSASVSPSRRRPPQHRPTAFLDIAPRVAPVAVVYGLGPEDEEAAAAARAASSRCFPLPSMFGRRGRDGGKKGGGSGRRSSGAASSSSGSSASSFRSSEGAPGHGLGGLRRSASSSSSSSCLSLSSRRSSGKLAEAREAEAAGGWFY